MSDVKDTNIENMSSCATDIDSLLESKSCDDSTSISANPDGLTDNATPDDVLSSLIDY